MSSDVTAAAAKAALAVLATAKVDMQARHAAASAALAAAQTGEAAALDNAIAFLTDLVTPAVIVADAGPIAADPAPVVEAAAGDPAPLASAASSAQG